MEALIWFAAWALLAVVVYGGHWLKPSSCAARRAARRDRRDGVVRLAQRANGRWGVAA